MLGRSLPPWISKRTERIVGVEKEEYTDVESEDMNKLAHLASMDRLPEHPKCLSSRHVLSN